MPTHEEMVKSMLGAEQEKHRLCFDFSNLDAVKRFFGACKAAGITHPESIPILMYDDGKGKSIWVVGREKAKPKEGAGEKTILSP